jgi:WD40 repeat protein
MTRAWAAAALVALGLACSGRGGQVEDPEVDPDDEDAGSACKARTEDDLAQAEMLALGGHLHRGLALVEAADARCSTAGSRWMMADILADLGLDQRSIAAYERYAREARTPRGKQAAAESIAELRKRPPPVRADASEDDRITALLLYRDGVNLRLAGKHEDAIRQLRRSYALLPHPLTIAQIALAHEDAGNAVEALKAHERALAIAEQLAGVRAVPRLLRGHVAAVITLAWSADGRRLATVGRDGLVAVWEPATGRILHGFTMRGAIGVALSADGTVVAGASENGDVIVWDAVSGVQRLAYPAKVTWRSSVALSADGSLVAAAGDHGFEVRRTAGGELVADIPDGGSSVRMIFTADNAGLIATRGNAVQIWQFSGKAPKRILTQEGRVMGIALSPDGSRLATAAYDGVIALWDLASGRKLRTATHGYIASDLAWSVDGRVLATLGSHKLRTWDPTTLDPRREVPAEDVEVALSPDGTTIATAGRTAMVQMWEATGDTPVRVLGTPVAPVTGIDFTADGRLLAVATAGAVDLWRLDAVRAPARVELPYGELQALAVDPRARWVAVSGASGGAYRIDTARAAVVQEWLGAGHLGAGGELLASCGGKYFELWNPQSGEKLRSVSWNDDDELMAVALTRDGVRTAIGGKIQLRTMGSKGPQEWKLPVDQPFATLEWSPSGGQIAGGMEDGSLRVWDTKDLGEPPRYGKPHEGRVADLAYSPDGALLASAGSDGRILLWDAATGAPRGEVGPHPTRARAVAFSASGRLLASGGDDGVVLLWDVARRALVATLSVSGGQWLAPPLRPTAPTPRACCASW